MITITLTCREEFDKDDIIDLLIKHCNMYEKKPLICHVADVDEFSTLDNIRILLDLNIYASKEDVVKKILSL